MAKYDAFISYRHSDLDMWAAKSIHKGLETFKVPRAVAKKTQKNKIKRVFRDQEELPIGSDLNNNISSALEGSEYLLVICSPRTPESYWVCKEIDTFISMHDRDHVLAILIEGEPQDSFPPQLLNDEYGNPVEPLAADIRGVTQKERNKKLKTELLRLAAPILGCSYDDLRQRHRERRIKKIATIICSATLIVSALSIGFGIYNANMVKKIKAQNEKIEAQNIEIKENYNGKLENQSRFLADTSLSLFENGDRRAAALVAVEALTGEDKPYVPNAQYALSQALYLYDTGNTVGADRTLKHQMPVAKCTFNDAGDYMATTDQGHTAYVWKVADGELVLKEEASFNQVGFRESIKDVGLYEDNLIVVCEHVIKSVSFSGKINWETPIDESINFVNIKEKDQIAFLTSIKKIYVVDLKSGLISKTIDNNDEDTFTETVAYRPGINKIGVARYDSDTANARLSVFDLNSGEENVYTLPLNFISNLYMTEDGNIVVQLTDIDLFGENSGSKAKAAVVLVDPNEDAIRWVVDDETLLADENATKAIIKSVNATDDDGNEKKLIVSGRDNHLRVIDEENGNIEAESYFNGGIEAIYLSASGVAGYVAENNGNIDVVNIRTGKNHTNLTINTNKSLSGLWINNGVLAVKERMSPDLYLYAYHDGKGKEEFADNSSNISKIKTDINGKYVAAIDVNDNVSIYDAKSHECIYDDCREYEGRAICQEFIDDDTFMCVDSAGAIYKLSLKDDKEDIVNFGDEYMTVDHYYITDNKKYAAFGGFSGTYLVDLSNDEVKMIDNGEKSFEDIILSEDAKWAYIIDRDGNVYSYNVSDEKLEVLNEEINAIGTYVTGNSLLALASDKYLAVPCKDGMLKILSLENGDVVAEFAYDCQSRCFMKFVDDGNKLLCQADDYYIKVYDVNSKNFVNTANTQWNQLTNLVYDKDNNIIILTTTYGLLFMDDQSYEIIGEAKGGRTYVPSNKKIYSKDNSIIYSFDYVSLEEMINAATEEFKNQPLTDEEKRQYYIS